MLAARDQAGNMRHVDHEVGTDLIGDLAEAGEVPDAAIGGAAGDDQLGLGCSAGEFRWMASMSSRSSCLRTP